MQGIRLNPTTLNWLNFNKQKESEDTVKAPKSNYTASGAVILANQNIAFMSKPIEKGADGIPKYDKSLVADEPEGHNSFYLRNNPERFYIKNGAKINNFLRTGELEPILETEEDVPDVYKALVAKDVSEKKDYNRALVDSVEILDSMMIDKTEEPMVVYRYAPKSWLDTEKDGVIKDDGFFSTIVEGEALDGYVNSKDATCFEVWIPENTPYLDLTDKGENEMLFPRGMKFDVIDDKTLVMLSKE